MLTYLVASCTFLLLIFATRLFYARTEARYLNLLFGGVILSRSLFNIVYVLVVSGSIVAYPHFLKTFHSLFYLIPGGVYLYVKGLVYQESRFKKSDLWHFTPFLFGLLDTFVFYYQNRRSGGELLDQAVSKSLISDHFLFQSTFGPLAEALGYLPFVLIYLAYLMKMYFMLKNEGFFADYKSLLIHKKWIVHGFVFVCFVQFFHLLQIVLLHTDSLALVYADGKFLYLQIIPISFLIVFLLYVLYHPYVLYSHFMVLNNWQSRYVDHLDMMSDPHQMIRLVKQEIQKEDALEVEVREKVKPEVAASYLTTLNLVMLESKPFLNPEFQVADLSVAANIAAHHCSFVLNKFLKKNFRDWTNEYRVHHFIELYKLYRKRKTVEALAAESGFKNMATFYNAFKKVMNVSPTAYFNKGILLSEEDESAAETVNDAS
jgi:AraC-like DNA-binding protein